MESLPWDFFFVMATIAVTVILPVIVLAHYFDMRKQRLAAGSPSDNELTTGELEELIRTTVEQSTGDLEQRLVRMEQRVSGLELRLPEPEEMSDEVEANEQTRAVGSKSLGRLRD